LSSSPPDTSLKNNSLSAPKERPFTLHQWSPPAQHSRLPLFKEQTPSSSHSNPRSPYRQPGDHSRCFVQEQRQFQQTQHHNHHLRRRQSRGLDDQDHLSHPLPHLQEFHHRNNNTDTNNNHLPNQQQQQLHTTTTTTTDDNSDFWTGDPFAGVDGAIGENIGGDFEFDWTALGLDPFGTQLVAPQQQQGSGATSSLTTPDLDSLDLLIDPLPEANLFFGDTSVPGLDDPSAMSLASSGGMPWLNYDSLIYIGLYLQKAQIISSTTPCSSATSSPPSLTTLTLTLIHTYHQ
jgi:hypothetical protein